MAAYLDHVGVAVKPDSRLAELLRILGLSVGGRETVPAQQVQVDWVPLPLKQAKIELIQPTSADGAIGKFLAKSGRDGVHHLSFRVDDIQKMQKAIADGGFQLVYPDAREGADHCLVNFVHPASTGGVLVEITQKH